MKILDATCGNKSMWYQKHHPFVTYLDKRNGNYGEIRIKPDVVASWDDMPFSDNYFDMVIFDPPHIVQNVNTGWLANKYGKLSIDNWQNELRVGIENCFRVLKPNGIFILKWNEEKKKIDKILKLFPYRPLFGTRTGQSNKTHWIVFLKYSQNKDPRMF